MRLILNPVKPLPSAEPAFRSRGLPFTAQRRAVWETLAGRVDHPTADDVYGAVSLTLPGLSRATVYRVLETFVTLGVARRVSRPGDAARFDARTDRHHHAVCVRCGRIADVDDPALDALPVRAARSREFDILDWSIEFTGVCRACRDTRSSESNPARRKRAPARHSRRV